MTLDELDKYNMKDMKPEKPKSLVMYILQEYELAKLIGELKGKADEWIESGKFELYHHPFDDGSMWVVYPGEPRKMAAFYRSFEREYPLLRKNIIYNNIQEALFTAKRERELAIKKVAAEKEQKYERIDKILATLAMVLMIGGIILIAVMSILEKVG